MKSTHIGLRSLVALALTGVGGACLVETERPDAELPAAPLADKGETTKSLPWSSSDAPSIFGPDLQTKLLDLPRQGAAATPPWPASYWPTYLDNINYKWAGPNTDAPSTKYGKAFNVQGVEDAVSRLRGIAGNSSRKACTQSSECDAQIGEECAKRDGQTSGYCIPTWWGICHAWGPASILTPEPKRDVTVNGVTFKVNDIRALVELVHDSVVNKFVSLRCNVDDGQGKIEYDEYGRPKEGDCIDTNPGTFHLLITNYLGLKSQSFVMDRTYDDEVWNQPLRGFRITQLNEVDATAANALVGVLREGGTTVNWAAQIAEHAWKHFDPVRVEANQPLKVAMRGTGDGDLYVRFAGQATDALYDCRPFDNGSVETCELTVPAGATQVFVSVHGYTQADVTLVVNAGGSTPTTYKFNANAKKFYDVKAEVDYITESDISTDGPLLGQIDVFTRTDRLHYLLEVDADGKIIGGEWLAESKRSHPDFLWLPLRVSQQSVAEGKIKYADVMSLLAQSTAVTEGGPSTVQTVRETGTVTRGQLKHYGPFTTAQATQLKAVMTGNGDADLYVRRGSAPTLSAYDCRPYANGSTEECTVNGPGDIYVAVHGYAASSTYELNITYTRGGSSTGGGTTTPPPPPPATVHLNQSGNVAQGAFAYFTVNVVAGQKIVVRTTAPNDVDVYLQMGQQPTTGNYVARGYTNSGNETVPYTPSATGVLHIGVHGYAASSFTLTTAAQ